MLSSKISAQTTVFIAFFPFIMILATKSGLNGLIIESFSNNNTIEIRMKYMVKCCWYERWIWVVLIWVDLFWVVLREKCVVVILRYCNIAILYELEFCNDPMELTKNSIPYRWLCTSRHYTWKPWIKSQINTRLDILMVHWNWPKHLPYSELSAHVEIIQEKIELKK